MKDFAFRQTGEKTYFRKVTDWLSFSITEIRDDLFAISMTVSKGLYKTRIPLGTASTFDDAVKVAILQFEVMTGTLLGFGFNERIEFDDDQNDH